MKHYEYEVSLFVENELPPDKKEELFLHLSRCNKCSNVLTDYQKLQSHISNFYNTLPSSNFNIISEQNRKNISWRVKFRKILIPVSVSALIIIMILFYTEFNTRQSGIDSANYTKREVSEKTKSNGKINLNSNSKHEENIKLLPIDYQNITDFNKINNTISLKEKVDRGLKNCRYNYELVEFNKAINKAFYNNFNY
ncbi:MAG: hypothetical protein WBV81_04210 [Ignavibacteriaceae bacterium]